MSANKTMTRDELLALPPVVDMETACRVLGVGRTTGYALAKQGQFPVHIHRIGKQFRIATADLHQLLGVTAAA